MVKSITKYAQLLIMITAIIIPTIIKNYEISIIFSILFIPCIIYLLICKNY